MKERLSLRQIYAFCLTALSAPAVTVCAGLPFPRVLILSVSAAVVELALMLLWRRAGTENLPELFLQAWGRPLATALLLAVGLFLLLLLWRLLPATDSAFPQEDTLPFVPLVLLAVAAWAAWQGSGAVIRAIGVLFFFVAALYLTVFAFALPDAEAGRLWSRGEGASLLPAAVLFLPCLGLYLPGRRQGEKSVGWLLPAMAFPPAVAAICAAVPGSRGSFYEMAKSVEVLSVAQRPEPMVSAILTVGWFAAVSLPILCVGEIAEALGLPARTGAAAFCVLAAPGAVWNLKLPMGILVVFGAVFCVIFPLLTLVIVVRKKVQKR